MFRYISAILVFFAILLESCIFSSDGKNEYLPGNTASGLSFPASKKEVVCFVYHRFGDDRYPSTNISVKNFEAHLNYLKSNGFEVMNLGGAVDYLTDNSKPILPKVAVITVDDGFKTFKTGAMPLLKKFGYSATLFINTETVGGNSYLDWEDLKSVKAAGIEIGNHTHSHPYFLNTPKNQRYDQFREEINLAQKLIKEHLDVQPDLFAYTYGEFDSEMEHMVKNLGFKAATAQNSGVIWSGSDPFALPRFPMAGPYANIDGFTEKANMRALPVVEETPLSFVLNGKNPPTLSVVVDDQGLALKGLQCFVQGGECVINIQKNGKTTIEIHATKALTRRRTLYTLTVPSADYKSWHWYSHLWIQPDIPE